MSELRALFTAGHGTRVSAQEVFTNRTGEVEAFDRSLVTHWESSAKVTTTSVRAGRNNVLGYYGLGGIGKTTLSRYLQSEFEAERPPLSGKPRRAAIRVDFGESGVFDLESFLLRLRAGLGSLEARWPAFDLAFNVYWERAHPNEPLHEFVARNPGLRGSAIGGRLADQLHESVTVLVEELGMAWTPVRLGRTVIGAISTKVRAAITNRRLLADCPYFEPLVNADASEETLSYLPSLLSWEIERRPPRSPIVAVAFLDTFESLQRDDRQIERLVQRAVFLMPNVLFVITGRNRLDWADATVVGELDYVGSRRWPGLDTENRTSDPRQHLVGYLSSADCADYLSCILQRNGGPAIDQAIRESIVAASGGLPLYLDLSVARYLDLLAGGRSPEVEDFGGPLAAVVRRIMRDLDAGERSSVRAAALVDCFDEMLIRAASGAPDACIARLLDRPFVERVELPWPYALHAVLKEAVMTVDHETRDAWSPREWREAAQRACDHLQQVCEQAVAAGNRSMIAGCFSQASRLAARHDLDLPWLVRVAAVLADAGLWSALDVRLAEDSPPDTATGALLTGVRGVALRRSSSLDASLEALDAALASERLSPEAREFLALHRTHSLRNAGSYAAAEAAYTELASQRGAYRQHAELQLADLHLLHGRFQDALDELEPLPGDPLLLGEALRVIGHTYRVNARFHQAESVYRQVADHAETIGSLALQGKALTNLAETLCWTRPDDARSIGDRAVTVNLAAGNQLEVVKAHVARAVAASGGDDASSAVETSLELVAETAYRAGAIFALGARAFRQLIDGAPETAMATREEVVRLSGELGVYQFWNEILAWWLAEAGMLVTVDIEPVAWLDGLDVTRQRWQQVLRQRRG